MEEKKENTNNTYKLSVIGFVCAVVATLIFLFYPDEDTVLIALIIMGVLSIVSIFLGFKVKKEFNEENTKGKGLATASRVVGIILLILCFFGIIGERVLNNPELTNKLLCPSATNCKDNGDGTKTCNYSGSQIVCNSEEIENN